MKKIRYSTKAKKDLKKYRNDLQLMKALYDVLEKLANGTILPKEYKAHVLIGKYKDCMECHIKSNFLLIWIKAINQIRSMAYCFLERQARLELVTLSLGS